MSLISNSSHIVNKISIMSKPPKLLLQLVLILSALGMIFYYAKFIPIPVIEDLISSHETIWSDYLYKINPFTVGSYMMGILTLFFYVSFKHIIIKVLISLLYIYVILFSLIAVMGVTKIWELYIYIPHLIIWGIIICIIKKCDVGELERV